MMNCMILRIYKLVILIIQEQTALHLAYKIENLEKIKLLLEKKEIDIHIEVCQLIMKKTKICKKKLDDAVTLS